MKGHLEELKLGGRPMTKLEKANKEIERLHSIIKEVREYIKDACYLDEINYPNSLGHKQTMKVLEILDKENKQ